MSIREQLELDLSDALRGIDQIESSLQRTAATFRVELARALDTLRGVQVEDVDATEVTAAIDDAVDDATDSVEISDADAAVVTSEIDSAVSDADTGVVVDDADAGVVTSEIDSAVDAADTTVEIDADTSAARSELDDLAKTATLLFTGPTAGFLGVTGAIGGAFQSAAADIVVATGASGDALDDLVVRARNVAREVPQGISDVALAVGELNTRLGVVGEPLERATRLSLDFARVNREETGPTVTNLGRIVNAFQLDLADLPMLLDQATFAAQATGIGVNELFSTMVEGGVVLEELGLGLTEQIALFGQFERVGLRPQQVVASMSRVLTKFAQEGVTDSREAFGLLLDEIREAPSATEAAGIAAEVFGTRVGSKLAVQIRAGTFDLSAFTEELEAAGGTLEDTAANSLTFSDQLSILVGRLSDTLGPLGVQFLGALEDMLPLLELAAGAVGFLAEGFLSLPFAAQVAVAGPVALLAVLGPMLFVGVKVVGMIRTLQAALVAGQARWLAYTGTVNAASAAHGRAGATALAAGGRMSGVAAIIGRAGPYVAAATVAIVATKALGDALHGLDIDATALLDTLERYGRGGELGGTALELLGEDLDKVQGSIRRLGAPGNLEKFNDLVASLTFGFRDPRDSFVEHRQRLEAVDAALAALVAEGNAEAAARAFGQIHLAAINAGVGTDRLLELLPQYQVAQRAATRETEAGAVALDRYGNIVDPLTGDVEGLDEATQDLATALARANAALDEASGAASPVEQAYDALGTSFDELVESWRLGRVDADALAEIMLTTGLDAVTLTTAITEQAAALAEWADSIDNAYRDASLAILTFSDEARTSIDTFIADLNRSVEAQIRWAHLLVELAATGRTGLLQVFIGLGAEYADVLDAALVDPTGAKLDEIERLYTTRARVAGDGYLSELARLPRPVAEAIDRAVRQPTKDNLDAAGRLLAEFPDEIIAAFDLLAPGLTAAVDRARVGMEAALLSTRLMLITQVLSIGDSLALAFGEGFRSGLERERSQLEADLREMADFIEDGIRVPLGAFSPSRVGITIGRDFAEGLAIGLRANLVALTTASGELARAIEVAATPQVAAPRPVELAASAAGAAARQADPSDAAMRALAASGLSPQLERALLDIAAELGRPTAQITLPTTDPRLAGHAVVRKLRSEEWLSGRSHDPGGEG